MRRWLWLGLLLPSAAVAQQTPDTLRTHWLDTIVITAPRIEVPLAKTPAAANVVGPEALRAMLRSIAVDEAVKLVPGVKVDNQADGKQVHVSMRGQGILSERGIRGIRVMLDGLPLNDPSGFAPDFYDVDWSTVSAVEVLRGPGASLYGGGSRVHTAFRGDNVTAKAHWDLSPRVHLSPVGWYTRFFNQNSRWTGCSWASVGAPCSTSAMTGCRTSCWTTCGPAGWTSREMPRSSGSPRGWA